MREELLKYIGKFNEKKHSLQSKKTENEQQTSVILSEKSSFAITEAYKTARTNLIFSLAGIDRGKKIIFTSAEPGEGKTTNIINMSVTFAQTGAKVILLDGDLRKPRVHRNLHFHKDVGLSEVLAGLQKLDDVIKHSDEYGIDCITAGQIPPNPVELLSSEKMKELLDTLVEKYDYVFVDTPPVTVVTDAASMSKYVDGYVVVVRHNYSIHELLEKVRSTLAFAEGKLLGYIINDIKPQAGIGYSKYGNYSARYRYKYRYRYGYKDGYRYGYGYGYGYQYGDHRNNIYSDDYVYGDAVEREDDK